METFLCVLDPTGHRGLETMFGKTGLQCFYFVKATKIEIAKNHILQLFKSKGFVDDKLAALQRVISVTPMSFIEKEMAKHKSELWSYISTDGKQKRGQQQIYLADEKMYKVDPDGNTDAQHFNPHNAPKNFIADFTANTNVAQIETPVKENAEIDTLKAQNANLTNQMADMMKMMQQQMNNQQSQIDKQNGKK